MGKSNYEDIDDYTLSIVREPASDYNKIGKNKEDEAVSLQELNFKYRLIKGRIAENLIQELFLSEGYQVYKNGIENTHPFLL
ncbi:hypothetical protein Q4Q35_10875 [Flavivirga aquimarina]|uniref:Uncharacterized protein n=1 Tax=Flavivirga aquimarina TaxID=2027862 RepID=A0ABT8WAY1_9FLAO|nr:hypothetical protein [Flavivirga aquimarina]MDO5970309.1 hypothetical protein [Flavivirga aquimarina]